MTGLDRPSIVWIPNELVRDQPVSDYDIALDSQDSLNHKETLLDLILAQHGDPAMAFPQESADDSGNVRAANKVTFYSDPERIPKYIVWNSEVKIATEERNAKLEKLLLLTETSPVLLWLRQGSGAHNDAWRKVKIQAMVSIKKAERKAVYWTVGLRRAIDLAQDLENAQKFTRYDREEIGVTPQDGIPLDPLDEANEVAILRGAGVMSLQDAVARRKPDPAAAAQELAALAAENAAKTPSIFFGKPMGNQEATTKDEGNEKTAAVAAEAAELEEAEL